MKKVLVTGCSGKLGSQLVLALSEDYEVHGLDMVDPKVVLKKFYKQDISRMLEVDESYDVVIHLAALTDITRHTPIQIYVVNINGTMNVINRITTKNLIYISDIQAETCENAYGVSKRASEDVVNEFCSIHNPMDYSMFRFDNNLDMEFMCKTIKDSIEKPVNIAIPKND